LLLAQAISKAFKNTCFGCEKRESSNRVNSCCLAFVFDKPNPLLSQNSIISLTSSCSG
jgi:hypothetical protein